MRLKDKLILRKVANQYVIVPIGKRAMEINRMVNISSSAAYLWDYMKKDEFTVDSLAQLIMERYQGVTIEKAKADIEKFLAVLKRNNMLEPEPGEENKSGYVIYEIKKVTWIREKISMSECNNLPQDPWYKRLYNDAVRDGIPLSGTFEITPRCNFNCKMCYVHLSNEKLKELGGELSADEWIRLGQEAIDAGTLWLCITGGDPLMHPEFKKIYKALAEMGFFITLQTNASMIDQDILELFEEYPPHKAKITVYGSNDEVYEAVCGVKNGFTRVDKGIRSLMKLGIPVELVTTIVKPNLKDIENIAKYARELGVIWYYSSAAYPSQRGAETDANAVAIDEHDATDFRAEIKYRIEHPQKRRDKKPCEMCKGYRTSFWILWDGQMRFCSFMNEPKISVNTSSLLEAWEELLEFEEALQWPEECMTCAVKDACEECIGKIFSFSGSLKISNKERCKKYLDNL